MFELELKFRVPDAMLDSLRQALLAHGAKRVRLQARYFDTADSRLARDKLALRLRLERGRWVQTLKATGEGIAHRLESEVPLRGSARTVPALDRHRHDGSPAGAALAAALQAAPDAALLVRHLTHIRRLHVLVHDAGGTCIEAALDIGHIVAGRRQLAIAELELEHKGGPVQGLFDLAHDWVLHGGLWLSSVSKSERGQRLLLRDAAPQAAKASAPRLDAGTDGPALLRALLQSALEQVLVNASEVAEGVTAVETIHQLRVGLRRLRVVLRELTALSPAIAPQWDTVLSAAFTKLGELRDQVAVAAAVRPLLEAAGSPALDWHAPPAADPCATVREPSFQVVLLEILALAHADAAGYTPMSPKAARALVASRLTKLHGQVKRGGGRFERLPLAEQHRVRKRLKRLRYLADFTASLWPGRDAQTYLKGLSEAQDALGLHNDVAVAAAAFARDAPAHPEAWFAAGYLQAHEALTARAARKAMARADQAPAFWT